jgi:hypothetical protein
LHSQTVGDDESGAAVDPVVDDEAGGREVADGAGDVQDATASATTVRVVLAATPSRCREENRQLGCIT